MTNKGIVGYHIKPGQTPDDGWMDYPEKKMKLGISSKYLQQDFTESFKELWLSNENTIEQFELVTDPFKACIFQDFISSLDVVNSIRHDFDDVTWYCRNMDLYEFSQSDDLKFVELGNIQNFYKFMKSDVMPWLSNCTGYNLNDISATCSNYTCTDYLLTHDDRKDDRCIAFIYYLSLHEWSENDGGMLELLNKDKNGNPGEVVRKLSPKNNQLIIFPVSNDSFHRVSEILSLEKARLSINGWFHVKDFNNTATVTESNTHAFLNVNNIDVDISSWIENYINCEKELLKSIQEQMEETSEISLQSFFKLEKFFDITETLYEISNHSDRWIQQGPLTKKSYKILNVKNLPPVLDEFLNMFQSRQFLDLLKLLTDLDLKSFKMEVQMWSAGDYELLGEACPEKPELDAIMYFIDEDPCGIIGAKTHYVALEETVEEALMTVEPSLNSLNLIFRDTDRFTKYYSQKSRCKKFFRLFCSYAE